MPEESNKNFDLHAKSLKAECNLYSKEVADKARNQSLAIFAFIALIVGILTTVGVFGLAKSYIDTAFENTLKKVGTQKLLTEIEAAKLNAEQSAGYVREELEAAKIMSGELTVILKQYNNPNSILNVGGDIVSPNNKWGSKSVTVGYGNASHRNTNKDVSCPNGTYVSGIEVEYGGTCQGKCDADGGIIRNIILKCSEL